MMRGAMSDRSPRLILLNLILACGLIFVGQWPRLSRAAYLDDAVPFDALIGGALLGWLFIAPLALYAFAALSHFALRALGGQGSHLTARLALFWSLLAATEPGEKTSTHVLAGREVQVWMTTREPNREGGLVSVMFTPIDG